MTAREAPLYDTHIWFTALTDVDGPMRAAARLQCAAHASDAVDLRGLLGMLGILR